MESKDKKIELKGCILRIKGKDITLTMEEMFTLKLELEKVFPVPPLIMKEPVYIPSQPGLPDPYPWAIPCIKPWKYVPGDNPITITWLHSTDHT